MHLERLNLLRRKFPLLAYEVIARRAQEMEYELLRVWPKRGDPRHPYATNRSAAGLVVKPMLRGIKISNRESYWVYVGKTRRRRFTGLAFRTIPRVLDGWEDEIVEEFTEALVEAVTPGR